MKLRILGSSIRLRLLDSEVHELTETGRVEDHLAFGPGEKLTYAVESHRDDEIALVKSRNEITILLPAEDVDEWAYSDKVGFKTVADNGEDGLQILVEKDLGCKHDEQAPDA